MAALILRSVGVIEPTSLFNGVFELIASFGSTWRRPGPASGMRLPRPTWNDKFPATFLRELAVPGAADGNDDSQTKFNGTVRVMGRQAKILNEHQLQALLAWLDTRKSADRNRLIVLLSFKAGLRAKEIASLRWSMVMNADGDEQRSKRPPL
jgi:integrase